MPYVTRRDLVVALDLDHRLREAEEAIRLLTYHHCANGDDTERSDPPPASVDARLPADSEGIDKPPGKRPGRWGIAISALL